MGEYEGIYFSLTPLIFIILDIWKLWVSQGFGQRNVWQSYFMPRKGYKSFICYENSEKRRDNKKRRGYTHNDREASPAKNKPSFPTNP